MTQLMDWTPDLSVGIAAIDEHHKRIVEYINELHEANVKKDREAVGHVLEELVYYAQSHFSFEEALMEQAGYKFLGPHKKVHELFTRRINDYVNRFKQGEEVAVEIQGTLVKWLMNHIKQEDMNYSPVVRASLNK
ncbi:MAG: bacteriohemerythrin [Sulfuritalea sp.]|jgi:hemerythrin|nr:bacteriohemerythrin [Sulfuritalea sp.]MDP1982892.1 bacteriohemerythrin [Sulfuritalea sp.]